MESQTGDNLTLSKTESIDSDIHIQNNNYFDVTDINLDIKETLDTSMSENIGDDSIEDDITYIHDIINYVIRLI